ACHSSRVPILCSGISGPPIRLDDPGCRAGPWKLRHLQEDRPTVAESSLGRGSAATTANGPPGRDCLQYRPQSAADARPAASWPPWRFAVLGATVAALTTGQSWLDAPRDTVKMRRRQLGGLIAAQLPDVGWQPPQATCL